ncbi:hypothetical protein QZH41_014540 [Actinostola sp. cb2023]|nr:hypothetical protein QZH41_014540 [Actinostola sp. cb2023]
MAVVLQKKLAIYTVYTKAMNVSVMFNPQPVPVKWGVCLPSACSERDIAVGFKDILKDILHLDKEILISTNPNPRSVYCAKPSEYNAGAIICLIICAVLSLLCLGGTFIDLLETSCFLGVASKEVNIQVQNGVIPNEGAPAEHQPSHDDTETLLNAGNMEPCFTYVPMKKNIIIKIFQCFSIITNTKKIMDTKSAPGAINSINGMRVLSISWVVLGHTMLWLLMDGLANNILSAMNIAHRFSFQAIDNAFFSVDSFFFLSGLLVGYIGLRRMAKNDGKLPWFKFYFHRIWRLTPTYMFVILFYATMNRHLNEGPLWYTQQQPTTCDKYWWTNLLYINNFHPVGLMTECLGWSWYLANDMQFYVISPLLLYAAYKFKLPGLTVSVGSLLVASFVATGAIMGYYHLPATQAMAFTNQTQGPAVNNFTNWVYIKPYCRIAPYLVGIILGYVFFADKSHAFVKKLRPVIANAAILIIIVVIIIIVIIVLYFQIPQTVFFVVGWCIAFIAAFSPLYGVYKVVKIHPESFTEAENIIYATFSRFSWAVALAWVIYACHTGYGGEHGLQLTVSMLPLGLVDKILSARFWMPLSRLTYGTYLVHPIVIGTFFAGFQHTVAYTDFLFVSYVLPWLSSRIARNIIHPRHSSGIPNDAVGEIVLRLAST